MNEINLKDKTKEELIQQIKILQSELKHKKYGLVWDRERERERERVVVECETNFPILKHAYKLDLKGDGPENILIEGDNYHALMCLNYTHKGKIDVIYIDPPYNTGNKDFIYNDKFVDTEDGYRHSKWLNFMYKRLMLAKELLTNDGVIFISIDEHEFAQLKLLCDQVFGENNYVSTMIWNSTNSVLKQSKHIRKDNEFIVVYSKNKKNLIFQKLENTTSFSNPDNDPKGPWFSANAAAGNGKEEFEIVLPNKTKITRKWGFTKKEYEAGLIPLYFKGNNVPRLKVYECEYDKNTAIPSSIIKSEKGTTTSGKRELENMKIKGFDTPKPTSLIKYLLSFATQNINKIVLDFFAGSGTTGHAVHDLNKEDNGNRKFILCTNNENKICEEVTYPRLKKIGCNLEYYKTSLIPHHEHIDSADRYVIAKELAEMIALKENTTVLQHNDSEDYYFIFTSKDKKHTTCVYYEEDTYKWDELLDKVKSSGKIYKFNWEPIDKFDIKRNNNTLSVEDIPEPFLNMYKKLNEGDEE